MQGRVLIFCLPSIDLGSPGKQVTDVSLIIEGVFLVLLAKPQSELNEKGKTIGLLIVLLQCKDTNDALVKVYMIDI